MVVTEDEHLQADGAGASSRHTGMIYLPCRAAWVRRGAAARDQDRDPADECIGTPGVARLVLASAPRGCRMRALPCRTRVWQPLIGCLPRRLRRPVGARGHSLLCLSGAGFSSGRGFLRAGRFLRAGVLLHAPGLRFAETQIRVEACQVNQPLDDGLGAGDEELALLFSQAFARPYKDRKAAAVHETKCGEIQHEELRAVPQGTVDGVAQTVAGAHVKFALQPQH
jgi:hypothetical protein